MSNADFIERVRLAELLDEANVRIETQAAEIERLERDATILRHMGHKIAGCELGNCAFDGIDCPEQEVAEDE